MTLTILVLVVSVANLGLGFVAASLLGRGPQSWRELEEALEDDRESPDAGSKSAFAAEQDLQVLLDLATAREQKLRDAKVATEDESQQLFLIASGELESVELCLDRLQARLLASNFADDQTDWSLTIETLREELNIASDQSLAALQEWSESIPHDAKERFRPVEQAFGEEVVRISEALPTLFYSEQLTTEQQASLEQWYHTSSLQLGQIAWQVRSMMRDLLAEQYEPANWDSQLLKDPGHQLPTLLALDARRRLEESSEETCFVARVRLDDDVSRIHIISRLLYRFAGEVVAKEMAAQLPDSWLVVPLNQGQWIVRGPAKSIDEFTATIEAPRYQLQQATIEVGDSTFRFTLSSTTSDDHRHFSTEQLLLILRTSMHEAECYGGGRSFITESGHPVPVMVEETEVQAKTFKLET